NLGQDTDPTPNTMTINVTAVNDAPAGTDQTAKAREEERRAVTASDFGFTDPNDTPANGFLSVIVTTLPRGGTLLLNGSPISAGAEVAVSDIGAGLLTFAPAANANGAGYASFTFHVRDDGGTANFGQDTDQSPNTMTIDVTAVNDAPVVTVPGTQS